MENVFESATDFQVVNLTPHPMNLYDPNTDELVLTVNSSGAARVSQQMEMLGQFSVAGHCVDGGYNHFGGVVGLPDPQDGVLYFVSALVATRAWELGRIDVVSPLEYRRDSSGMITGLYSFQFNPSLAAEQ